MALQNSRTSGPRIIARYKIDIKIKCLSAYLSKQSETDIESCYWWLIIVSIMLNTCKVWLSTASYYKMKGKKYVKLLGVRIFILFVVVVLWADLYNKTVLVS